MSVPTVPEGSVLRAAQFARHMSLDALAAPGRLLVVAPHPDDETLGCGMALAAASAGGRQVAILLLTDGEGSHPKSRAFDTARRVAMRAHEFDTALATLVPERPTPVVRAHLPDGQTSDKSAAQVCNRLLEHRCIAHADTIWTTWVHDPHCDHRTAAILARMLSDRSGAALWSFAVWGRFGDCPVPENIGLFFDSRFYRAKRDAMDAYASQMTDLIDDDPAGFTMPPALFEHFASHPEVFFHER
ncbi:PIG-L deacetylase family protein [Qipengyuania sp. MTN3-11]|uniref:PIG-L deacetylase family protein n=1 Tax=Qipengyuania sp. MTN3-11 TaxID=3056557 RepID=UPI0036F23487